MSYQSFLVKGSTAFLPLPFFPFDRRLFLLHGGRRRSVLNPYTSSANGTAAAATMRFQRSRLIQYAPLLPRLLRIIR